MNDGQEPQFIETHTKREFIKSVKIRPPKGPGMIKNRLLDILHLYRWIRTRVEW